LQRRLRDAHALTQHFLLEADTFTKVGAVLAGQDVDLALFGSGASEEEHDA
jgi:indole-3-acetate monooxygenase